jgi:hypothetical protein
MSISIQSNSNYNYLNNISSNKVNNKDAEVTSQIFSSINKTFSDLGVDINPAELAKNTSMNNFMNDLFNVIEKNETSATAESIEGKKAQSYSDSSTKIQDLISQLNQDNSASIALNQLKQDFSKISGNKNVDLQTFLSGLVSNLNGSNIQSTGNNLDIFAS